MLHSADIELSHLGQWLEMAVYVVTYAILRAVNVIISTLDDWAGSVREQIINMWQVVGLRKWKFILPSHVALSCPFLCASVAREQAIATIVAQLFTDGVLHITLHDPASVVDVSRLLHAVCAATDTTLSSAGALPVNIFVTHIGPEGKNRAVLPHPVSVGLTGDLYTEQNVTNQKAFQFKETCFSSLDDTDAADLSDLRNVFRSEAPVLSEHDVRTDVYLTIVSSQSARAPLVRASQKLATNRRSDCSKLTIEDVHHWLDNEPLVANLSSEPDVLAVFPAPSLHSVPILHNFPIWQLRLTVIIFAKADPDRMPYRTLARMIESAARKPKRCGR